MTALSIGEVADRAGVGVQTIRYYERRGLVSEPPRSSGGFRQFPERTVRRIRFIKRAQGLGFTLEEIEELLNLRADESASCSDVRSRAVAKLHEIDEKIDELREMREALQELVDACSGEGPVSECPCLEALWPSDD